MSTAKNIALFLICNIIGAFTAPTIYGISFAFQLIDIIGAGLDQATFEYDILIIQLNWLACALFSISIFFLSGTWKKFFLSAPILVPLILTSITMLKY